MRKIDQLKAILDSAEHPDKWDITTSTDPDRNGGLDLDSVDVTFLFDKTGEHLEMMLNMKE
jgi:hypothetical protein